MDEQNKAGQVEDPADDYKLEVDPEEVADSDDSDVAQALERETQDGKGGAVVPKSDFDSFATDDVEDQESASDNEDQKGN